MRQERRADLEDGKEVDTTWAGKSGGARHVIVNVKFAVIKGLSERGGRVER